jgi:hypothetical protein
VRRTSTIKKVYTQLGAQALAAFCPAGINNGATTTSCHASPEPMPAGAFQKTWLKSTFHFLEPQSILV